MGMIHKGLLAAVCLLPLTAGAVDGVIEINHARALAGGVTPGDAPGYPVTIDRTGSYRLTGNLTQPDATTDVIRVTGSDVSIDLNGFTIQGQAACDFAGLPGGCAGPVSNGQDGPTGRGAGILAYEDVLNLHIMNGFVVGTGFSGLYLFSRGAQVSRVGVRATGGHGIIAIAGMLDNVTVQHNRQSGILGAAIVRNAVASFNGANGIEAANVIDTVRVVSNRGSGVTYPYVLNNAYIADNTLAAVLKPNGHVTVWSNSHVVGNPAFSPDVGPANTSYCLGGGCP